MGIFAGIVGRYAANGTPRARDWDLGASLEEQQAALPPPGTQVAAKLAAQVAEREDMTKQSCAHKGVARLFLRFLGGEDGKRPDGVVQ